MIVRSTLGCPTARSDLHTSFQLHFLGGKRQKNVCLLEKNDLSLFFGLMFRKNLIQFQVFWSVFWFLQCHDTNMSWALNIPIPTPQRNQRCQGVVKNHSNKKKVLRFHRTGCLFGNVAKEIHGHWIFNLHDLHDTGRHVSQGHDWDLCSGTSPERAF